MKKLLYLVAFLLVLGSVDAATIHGEVIAWDTFEGIDSIVEINTEPKQQDVVKAGEEYSFQVEKGTYTIFARSSNEAYDYTEEIVINSDEGDFVFDLILFDTFLDIPDPDLNDTVIDPGQTSDSDLIFWLLFGVLLVLVLILFFYKKKPKSIKKIEEEVLETDEDLEKVLKIIKESQGRITQKDIRKRMVPLSEAKVSLLITELEDKGVIKRIKKGRGNVIILVKK